MKRGVFAVACLAFALSAGMAFAKGPGGLSAVGVYGNYGFTGGGAGIGLSLKFNSFPVIGIKYNLDQAGYLGASCDYYVLDGLGLVDSLGLYLGIGAYAGIDFGDTSFDLGLRFPIGLQVWVIRKKFEIFLAAIPAVPVVPTIDILFGMELGARFYF